MFPVVRVAPSPIGNGLFASEPIPAGAEILEFSGRLISYTETLAKGEREGDPLQVGPDLYVDLESPGVFVNHSCDPNSRVFGVTLISIRDIPADTEITFDYSTTIGPDDPWKMQCECNNSNCRRSIAAFTLLSVECQQLMLDRRLPQDFLRPPISTLGRRDQTIANRVLVGKSPLGFGVFATDDIRPGEKLFRSTGKVISKRQAIAKGDAMGDPIQIAINAYLDVEEPARSLNHSCAPNAGIIDNIDVVALRPIAKDEEVTIDYSTTISSDDGWTMPCRCGASICRKLIGAYAQLSGATQIQLQRLGIVPNFILRDAESYLEQM